MEPAERAARQILEIIESTYQSSHDYVPAETRAFRHLDLTFYERTSKLLTAKGFVMLGDVEDRTITNTPHGVLMPVMIRCLRSANGTVTAAIYHPRIRPIWLRVLLFVLRKTPGKVVDMETECDDGSFVVTTNAAAAAAIDVPALIETEYLPATARAQDVLQRHSVRVSAHLAARPGVQARVITTHAQMVAMQNRMNALKAAFRGEVGGITKAELDRLTTLGGASQTAAVHAEIVVEQARRAS
jgi:hypothetical protein